MTKKVLIIGTSPRRNGNSNRLAQEFEKGAQAAGNTTELIYLDDKKIRYCQGCLSCTKTKKCFMQDDANAITEKIRTSDVIVWATPVYYYCISGQMKTMIDRSNPLYVSEKQFKEVYLLATAAEDKPAAVDGAVTALQGWIDCHPGVALKGVIRAVGVGAPGDIENKPVLKDAFEMGKAV